VWDELLTIPYGEMTTYGEVARLLSARTGRTESPRAVGSAVGRNPILVMVPCHRVVGASGSLTGYAAGIDRKERLLRLEGASLPADGRTGAHRTSASR
jgi:methylated-DNA-[protein]-cysteine S-methyltransferase